MINLRTAREVETVGRGGSIIAGLLGELPWSSPETLIESVNSRSAPSSIARRG